MIPGESSEYVLARLLGEKCGSGATGILTAVRGKLKRLFCFRQGIVVFVASNVLEEQYVEFLVQEGILSPADRAAAKSESSETKRNILEVIREREYVGEDALRRAMDSQVENLLRNCLTWPDGEFSFEAGSPNLDGQVMGGSNVLPLLMDHVQRYPGVIDVVRRRIGPPDVKLLTSARAERIFSDIEPDDTCRFLLDQADGERLVGELTESAPADSEAATRSLYGLLLLQAVEACDAEPEAPATGEPALTRNEVLGRLAKSAGGDHYVILGLDRNASRQQIRDAYYALARRMHPDRFRTGELQDLLARIEKFFTRVTEAYNTLYDPDRKSEYDEMLETVFEKKATEPTADAGYLAKQNFLRGKALVEMRRYVDAVPFLENAVKMDESQSEYHFELGSLLVRNPRRKMDAERHLFRAFELDPSRWRTYLALGHMYLRAELGEEAIRMFREVLRWESEQPDAIQALKELGAPRKAPDTTGGLQPRFGG